MPAVVVTLDAEPTHTTDHERVITGSLHLSTSYANGTGDTFTPLGAFGLDILTDLWIQPTTIIMQLTDTLPLRGTTTSHIKAYGTGSGNQAQFAEMANSDLSAVTARFRAYGY